MNRQRGFAVMLILYAIAAVGVAAMLFAAWHTFTESYRDDGRKQVREQWAPLIDQCAKLKSTPAGCANDWQAALENVKAATAANRALEGDVVKMRALVAAQNLAVTEAEEAVRMARDRSSRILADLAKRTAATQSEIARLAALAAQPAANREEACREADSILRALADRRLRYTGTAEGADQRGADNGRPGAGSGALRVGP